MTSTNVPRRSEVIRSPKWVRVFLGGEVIADSRSALLLRGQGRIAVYYFPAADVRVEKLEAAPPGSEVAGQGEGPWPEPPQGAKIFTVRAGRAVAENAAWQVQEPPEGQAELKGHIAFVWQEMDAWYEEEEQVRVHPHDPYHLIDVRPSSRHVRVVVAGQLVAETRRPVLLFETGLPVRYYIPKMDVRMDLLTPSDKTTHCAYKGTAPHYSLTLDDKTVDHIAWHYPFPNPEYAPIQNLVAFYQERIKEFYVDGERLEDGEIFGAK